MRRPAHTRTRAGFSLMEAMVVLAVAGMALMLIFAVATTASGHGFRLGRLALGAADAEVADDAFRNLVAGLEIAPTPPAPGKLQAEQFEGGPEGFSGPAVLGRGSACAPAGPVAGLRVEIVRTAQGDRVACKSRGAEAVLLQLSGPAAFAYSEDGRSWTSRWTDRPAFGLSATTGKLRFSRRLWVRLATGDGRFEIIAVTARDRPAEVEPEQAEGPVL